MQRQLTPDPGDLDRRLAEQQELAASGQIDLSRLLDPETLAALKKRPYRPATGSIGIPPRG